MIALRFYGLTTEHGVVVTQRTFTEQILDLTLIFSALNRVSLREIWGVIPPEFCQILKSGHFMMPGHHVTVRAEWGTRLFARMGNDKPAKNQFISDGSFYNPSQNQLNEKG